MIELSRSERKIIRTLSQSAVSYWELLSTTAVDFPLFVSSVNGLLNNGTIYYDEGNFALTEIGNNIATKHRLNLRSLETFSSYKGENFTAETLFSPEQLSILKKAATKRPERCEDLDQAFAPLETILARTAFFYQNCDIENCDILVLGDDDCMGLALALTGLPRRVVILEFDERMVEHYQRLAPDNLTVIQHDLRLGLPSDCIQAFDVFFTDPTPTIPVMSLFASRGLQGLKGIGSVGYVTLSQMEASPKKWHQIQHLLLEAGCAVTAIIPNFNTYELEGEWLMTSNWRVVRNAPVNPTKPSQHWYRSSLVRVELVSEAHPPIHGEVTWGADIYMDDELLG